jgi:hypothetical protein
MVWCGAPPTPPSVCSVTEGGGTARHRTGTLLRARPHARPQADRRQPGQTSVDDTIADASRAAKDDDGDELLDGPHLAADLPRNARACHCPGATTCGSHIAHWQPLPLACGTRVQNFLGRAAVQLGHSGSCLPKPPSSWRRVRAHVQAGAIVAGLLLVAARLNAMPTSRDEIPAGRKADYFRADGKGLIPGWSTRAHEPDRSAAQRKRRRPVLRSLRLFALNDIQCASRLTSIPSFTHCSCTCTTRRASPESVSRVGVDGGVRGGTSHTLTLASTAASRA